MILNSGIRIIKLEIKSSLGSRTDSFLKFNSKVLMTGNLRECTNVKSLKLSEAYKKFLHKILGFLFGVQNEI